MKLQSRRALIGVIGVAAAIGVVGGVALASVNGESTISAKGLSAIKVVRGPNATDTASSTYTNLPGAITKIKVPSRTHAVIVVDFSAESNCTGTSVAYCSVRIKIGRHSGQPNTGTDFAFDSADASGDTGGAGWKSAAMQRSSNRLGPGTYTVKVQYATVNGATDFRLDDWSMSVERFND
jgi:hypothetical protein